MASEPQSSWGTVLCGCLPWTGQPESPDQAAHPLGEITLRPAEILPHTNEAVPNPDDIAPKPGVVVPKPDEVVPAPSEAVIQLDEAVPRPDEAKPRQDEVAPDEAVPPSDEVTPGSGKAAPITTIADASKDNTALRLMKLAMRGLHEALDVFPPLKIAVGGLIECATLLQIADQNRQEYEQLISRLAGLASLLQKHLSDSKPTYMPYSIENVARAIEEQVRHIQQRQGRSGSRQLAAAREAEDDILGCYRRVEELFQQLQTDISLSIWDVVKEEQMENRMQRLLPADDAWYHSSLTESTTKRRACTAGTRTKVLADARNWTQDEDAPKIYWMNGMAGTGKTTIAYSLCEKLEKDKQLGASFFCSRNSPNCRHVNKIIPTIAYQIGRYSNPYRQALCDVLNNNRDVAKLNIKTQFEQLMVKPLGGVKGAIPRDVVVVLDALDECTDVDGTKQVLDLLFQHATDLPIKFFVTSRPEPGITSKMMHRSASSRSILHLHEIEDSFVQADIRMYLMEALSPIRPSAEQVERLVTRAGRLFIFAATVVRFISPNDESADHGERLTIMLGATSNPEDRDYEDIDNLYLMILTSALGGGKPRAAETRLRRQVLWTVVCAREPLTTSAITKILGVEHERKVELAIQPLRSVLNMSESSRVVSTLHASFPDFLLSKERAGSSLFCDEAEHNAYLANCCFDVMKRSLRFNICNLETSYKLDKQVPDLESRVNDAISPELFYACRYWGEHLTDIAASAELRSRLDEFLRYHLLFWMELLNLKGWIGHCEDVLSQVLSWLQSDDGSTELRQFAHDARNFVTTFAGNPTSRSTPHIYLSALPFTSKQSHVWTNYWPRTQGLLRVEGTGMEGRGGAALATWGVGSAVKSISQSNDGKRIVCGADDGTVSIWDVSTGTRIVGPLQSRQHRAGTSIHLSYGPHVVFSSDDTRIASGSDDCTIRIWASHNGNLIIGPLDGHSKPVLSITFSPDGTRLVSGSEDHTIRMWDAHNGHQLGDAFMGHNEAVICVAYSQDGKLVVSGSSDETIRLWDPLTGTTILGPLRGHTHWVRAVAFSRDGMRVVSGSDDNTIRAWDAKTGTALADPFEGHTYWVMSVAFSPDGMRVVSGSRDNTIRIWNPQNGALIAGPLEGHRGRVNSVLFSTDGTRILSGSDDGTICVWDARHGTAAAKSSGHTEEIYSVAFSPDGTRAVSGSGDRTIRVWDTRDGRLVLGPLEGHTGSVRSVAFSPDGAQIVSGSDDDTIRTWYARSGGLIAGPFEGHTGLVWSVAYSPDGNRIASGSADNTIRVWHFQTGTPAAEPFTGHTDSVLSVAWSPDETRIVSGSSDKTVRMWNAHDGTSLWTSDAHTDKVYSVAYSPDGARVVSGSKDCTILVLNALDGTVLHGPFKDDTGYIWSVAFSPDGTRIVSGSEDHSVCVWDAEKGTVVSGPFKGHTGNAPSVAFSPDGRRVVSCSQDRTIRFWEVATADKPLPAYFDHCILRDDGWVTHSDSQLLIWLPPDLRTIFPLPSAAEPFVISPEGVIRADYNDLLLGEYWRQCYYHDSASGATD